MTSLMAGGSEGGLQSENNQEDFGREDSFGGCSYATGEKLKIHNSCFWIAKKFCGTKMLQNKSQNKFLVHFI